MEALSMDPNARNGIPSIRLQSDSVVFIETQLDDIHPGFANPPSHFDDYLQAFVMDDWPPEAGTECLLPVRERPDPGAVLRFWNELFAPAMAKFVAEHPKEPSDIKKKGHSIRKKSSWNDVYDELEEAKNKYSQTDTGFKGAFRKVYRKSADHGAGPGLSVVKAGQKVLNNDYVTPVLGALQLVLEAATKAVKLRQDMVAAFDDINRRFTEIEIYLQVFDGDESIRTASIDLIAAILRAVELVLGFFVSCIYTRALKVTFTIDQYRETIDKSLRDIEAKSSCLMREVDLSKAHRDCFFQQQTINNTRAARTLGNQMLKMIHSGRNEIKGLFDDFMRNMNDIKVIVSRPSSPVPPIHLYMMASGPPDMGGATHYNAVTTEDILDWIDIPNLAEEDLELIATHSHVDISDAEQGRAEQLVTNLQLKEWLSTPASSQLLIHGNYDGIRPVSGLSLLCASLALNLDDRNDPHLIRLLFFCGLHDGNQDNYNGDSGDPYVPLVGGRALVASFICQLLSAFDFGPELPLPQLGDVQVREDVRYGTVDALCFVFNELVRRLPRGTVVLCIVDAAVYYERREFVDDTSEMLELLLQLSRDVSVAATVKVLVTSPTRTTVFRQLFPGGSLLSMDAIADAQWEASRLRTQRLLGGQTVGDDEIETALSCSDGL